MTVIPLHALPEPEPTGHVTLQPAARHAMTALEGQVNELRRIFAGPSTPAALLPRIAELTGKIRLAASEVQRFSR